MRIRFGRRQLRRWLVLAMSMSLLQVVAGPVAGSATGTENINLELPTGLDINGFVIDPLGDPIEGASAGLCADEYNCFTADGETDASGHYTALGIAAGTYLVKATAQGFLEVWLGADGTSVTDVSQAVTIDISGDSTIPTLQLAAGFSMSGTLSDPDGYGVPDIQVIANGDSGGGIAFTDAGGLFVITGLKAGFYGVQVAPPVGSPFTGGSILGGAIVRDFFEYTIEVNGDETGIDATLVVGRSISGTVTGLSGPADVNVSGTPFGRALDIEPDGTFIVTGLWPDEPQTLLVGVRSTGGDEGQFPYGVYDGTPILNPDQSAAVAIDVSGGDVTGLTLAAPSLPSVTGTVLDEQDAAPSGFVMLCSDDLGCVSTSLAGDGSFAFINLPDSTFHMYVAAFQHLSGFVTASGGVSNDFGDAVDIVVAGADQVVDVVVQLGLTISGTITGPNGEPVVGGNVGASSSDGASFASGTTDAAGAYVIGGLVAGDYYVHVNGPEGGDYLSGYWSVAGYTAVYEEAGTVHVPSDITVALSTNPLDGATDVARTVQPSVTYSATVDVSGATVQLREVGLSIATQATASYDDATHTLTVHPRGRLHGTATYVFDVGGVVAADGTLVEPVSITFTTRR